MCIKFIWPPSTTCDFLVLEKNKLVHVLYISWKSFQKTRNKHCFLRMLRSICESLWALAATFHTFHWREQWPGCFAGKQMTSAVVVTCANTPYTFCLVCRIDIAHQAPQNLSAALLVYNQGYRGKWYERFLPAFRFCETFPMLTRFNLTFHSGFTLNLHSCNQLLT